MIHWASRISLDTPCSASGSYQVRPDWLLEVTRQLQHQLSIHQERALITPTSRPHAPTTLSTIYSDTFTTSPRYDNSESHSLNLSSSETMFSITESRIITSKHNMDQPLLQKRMSWPMTLAILYTAILMLGCGAYLWPLVASRFVVDMMVIWVGILIIDYYCKTKTPSLLKAFGLFFHIIPALFIYSICLLAEHTTNGADVWLVALMVFRYWRTCAQMFFWCMYEPVRPTDNDTMKPKDCTVILPTVGPNGNTVFEDLLASVLTNQPARIIFSTNTASAAESVGHFLDQFRAMYEAGATDYQQRYNLPATTILSDIQIINVGESNKRLQIVAGLAHVSTHIVVCADDPAEWTPRWLTEALAAFNNPKVGLVGTRKWVKDLPQPTTKTADGVLYNTWLRWYARFWNNMGGLYLIRHNFEIQSTNAADGGVFCVSGRSCLMRAEILDKTFQHDFTHECILGCGPVKPDDDVFITRWVLKAGWKVKVQCQTQATMTTVLGKYPQGFKFFPEQCQRWSRSTFRQNPIALFVDRNIWWEWPVTVWTTYFPWLYNAALVWDVLAVYTLTQTTAFATSAHPWLMLGGLVYFLQLTKLVKTAAWWWAHPVDFLLYFVIPVYPAFTYCHSVLKIYTAFTCLDMEWSGRKLPPPEKEDKSLGASPEK